ncbi:hypothetical protein AHMF7605_03905 [Adhaeribacter arboris]|uniref:Uncharacterized protein n=1 Tax=Adhaeribacter arboris TaxID=2072846 RepID=A0A2T2YBA7_9BACT|nr:hypothetical protein AHMF7605_03905 [Adhaeribacter arboris]
MILNNLVECRNGSTLQQSFLSENLPIIHRKESEYLATHNKPKTRYLHNIIYGFKEEIICNSLI